MDTVRDFLKKIMDSFGISSLIIAVLGTSLCFLAMNLFLPVNLLKKLHLEVFFEKYSYIVMIALYASLFLLISIGVRYFIRWNEKRKNVKYEIKQRIMLFKNLKALKLLYRLLYANSQPVLLNPADQKVKWLSETNTICRVGNRTSDGLEPYVLQPWAEERLVQMDESTNSVALNGYYSLIVQANYDGSGIITMSDDRMLEGKYTDDELKKEIYPEYYTYGNALRQYNEAHLIPQMPVIFGDEYNEAVNKRNNCYYYGKITKMIRTTNNEFKIKCNVLGSVPISEILGNKDELLIKNYELSRTHLAIKKANAIGILNLDYKND